MLNNTTSKKKLSFFGADMPAIDYVVPYIDSLELVLKHKGAGQNDIQKLNHLYDSILNVFGKYSHGGKYSFSEEQTTEARKLAYEMERFLGDYEIQIRHTGGTIYNKMYNLKAILGDAIECNLVGTVGEDAKGKFLYDKIKREGINLINNGEFISTTREAVHIIPRGEIDRTIGKFIYKTPSFMNYDSILEKALCNDVVFIEGATMKFLRGAKNLVSYVDILNENNKKLIFSPPTDMSFYFDEKTKKFNRENSEALFYSGRKSDFVFMNEIEAIKFTGNPRFEGEISGYDDHMMATVRKRIDARMNGFFDNPSECVKEGQVAFITMGEHGSLAINKNYELFQPAEAGIKLVSTSGCGDAFAAGATARLFQNGFYTGKDILNEALIKGTQVASAVIQEMPAQIGAEKIKTAFDNRPSMTAKQNGKVLRDNTKEVMGVR
jgi:sugar/nucleoside kinase (ribokinase family)